MDDSNHQTISRRRMELALVPEQGFWSLFLLLFLLPCMYCIRIDSSTLGNETDQLALIAFKDWISEDPFHVFNSWNYSLHFCNWEGVTCSRRHPQRVTSLNLGSHRLGGLISPHIANLTFLRSINLSSNSFHGEIPREMGQLFQLRDLNLSFNMLQGGIPDNLSNCSELRSIILDKNKLMGIIPVEFSSLSKLATLNLGRNNLTGNIPPPLGNISSLVTLYLYYNGVEGSIPNELGRLVKLQNLDIYSNNLFGLIPPSLYNLSSIVEFCVTFNRLHGKVPANLGLTLPNLKYLHLSENAFTGPIPVSLPNASELAVISFANNNFKGPVPRNLGRLQDLHILFGLGNHLGGGEGDHDLSFLTSLTNCSHLEVVHLHSNRLRGELPASIANLSIHLKILELGKNPISGSISTDISNLFNLNRFGVYRSFVKGIIPIGVGKLRNLQGLYLYSNRLSGQIPSSIGNITQLVKLYLDGNCLQGSIPSSLGNCHHLETLVLGRNKLNGTIPKEILSIPSLVTLNIDQNSLVGSLTPVVGKLELLQYLLAADNKLMGEIPSEINNCLSLEVLNLSNNLFQGAIPPGLNNLKGIKLLDLSHNNLSGHIPEALQKFPFLEYLDLSSNDLEGQVPTQGVFKNSSKFSILGNNKLCGGIAQLWLPVCPKKAPKKHGMPISLKVILFVVGAVLGLILLSFLFASVFWVRRKANERPLPVIFLEGQFLNVSYVDLFKATGGFSLDNLIGVGSYGSVYKGLLDHDQTCVAVKVFNLQQHGASKSFMVECEALRNIRHRNLVKIITACSSIDFEGNEFKALVFEYMPNGSLEKWLHPSVHGKQELWSLNLIQRLDIAIDVASALEYLHHHCHMQVIHRDLKPSNVLLDDDMHAHVGDFGIAGFLSSANTSQDQTRSSRIKGSIGYVPPEYGMGGKASARGDVYSYGILLLEMFIGKRPTDFLFKDGLSLHEFAKMALPDQVMRIVDQRPLSEEVQALSNKKHCNTSPSKMQECLVSIVKIGVACSVESPSERMNMRDIVVEMHAIRDLYIGFRIH